MKLVFLFVLAFGAVTASVGLLTQPGLVAWPAEEKPAAQPNTDLPKAAQPKPAKEQARVDRYGDPLPHNALLRLGTVRLRAMAFRFAFLPGDKRLVSVGAEEENVGQVWDINTGRVVRRLEMGNGYLASSAFTPDGKMVALAYTDKKTSYLLYVDTATGKEFRRHNMPAHRVIGALAFTPDGRTLAGWCDDETIRLWDAATGREIRQTKERQAYVTVLTISPDAQTLASAGADRTIRLWDVKTGAEQHKIEGFPGQIWSLAFAPDGTTLASVGKDDKTIRLWDVKTGQLRRRLEGHQDAPHRVTFSPDGKLLASAAASPLDDHSIRLWDAATGRLLRRIDGSGYWGTACLVISSDGKKLAASGGDHTIRLWDTATGEELHARGEQQSWVLSVTYSPNGKMLATGCQDETIRLWDASTGALLHRFRGDKGGVSQVIFSPDGKTLATSGRDKIVRLLDQTSGKELRRFKASQGSEWWFITSLVAFSPDGKIVATTGANHTIRLWSVRTGELLQRLEHKAEIHSIAFSPDGKFLASGEGNFPLPDNGIVRLWEIASGREVRHWSPEGTRWFDTVNFSPDGKTIAAVGCYSPSIYLWDTATGEERRRLVLADKTWSVALAFSPDGRTLATGSEDHLIRLWETATGKERRRFVGHQARIRSLAFSPDGRLLASGSDDTTALIWDVTGRSTTAPDRALSAEELRALWDELASKDAGKAFDAIGLLTAKPEMALPLLKEKLRTAPAPADRQQVARLIAELDDEQFSVRQKAREELRRLDERAEPGLQEALKGKLPLETRKRIEELLEGVRVSAVSPEKLRPFRAVEVLEHVGTAAARDVLKTLAEGASEARLTREAKASLQRLTSRAALEP